MIDIVATDKPVAPVLRVAARAPVVPERDVARGPPLRPAQYGVVHVPHRQQHRECRIRRYLQQRSDFRFVVRQQARPRRAETARAQGQHERPRGRQYGAVESELPWHVRGRPPFAADDDERREILQVIGKKPVISRQACRRAAGVFLLGQDSPPTPVGAWTASSIHSSSKAGSTTRLKSIRRRTERVVARISSISGRSTLIISFSLS